LLITRTLRRGGAGAPANHETLGAAALLSAQVFVSDDAREGMQAFREKRAPRWVVS
jgi:enoyl-CoA hydratase/carnithine racemase